MRQHRSHLHLMPPPTSPRGVERVDSGPILAWLAANGNPEKITAAHLQAIKDRNEVIESLQDKLDTANEDREAWRLRALSAEAGLRRPSLGAAIYAMAAMGWQSAWGRFESSESRATAGGEG